jgi:hypothetical protein
MVNLDGFREIGGVAIPENEMSQFSGLKQI